MKLKDKSIYKFHNFNKDEKINMCFLMGCDYKENIPGIGIKTAIKICDENKDYDSLKNAVLKLNNELDKDFKEVFIDIHIAFKHQIVYNSKTNNIN